HLDHHLRALRVRVPGVRWPRGRGLRGGPGRAPLDHPGVPHELPPDPDLLGFWRHREVLRVSVPIALVRRLAASVLVVGLVAAWLVQPGPDRNEITVEFARAGLNVRPGDEV